MGQILGIYNKILHAFIFRDEKGKIVLIPRFKK